MPAPPLPFVGLMSQRLAGQCSAGTRGSAAAAVAECAASKSRHEGWLLGATLSRRKLGRMNESGRKCHGE
eukprot:4991573-Prymnesium_polylepis.1